MNRDPIRRTCATLLLSCTTVLASRSRSVARQRKDLVKSTINRVFFSRCGTEQRFDVKFSNSCDAVSARALNIWESYSGVWRTFHVS